jgi:hypothetical protein
MGAKPWSFEKKTANKRGIGSPNVFIGTDIRKLPN